MTDELKEAVERVTALAASWEASSSSREDWHEALPDDVRADMAADAEALRTVLKAAARPVAPAVPAGVREALEAARMVLANEATSGAEWRSAEVRVAAALAAIAQPEGGAASTSEGVREPYAPGSNEWWTCRRVANGDVRQKWYELTDEDRAALAKAEAAQFDNVPPPPDPPPAPPLPPAPAGWASEGEKPHG